MKYNYSIAYITSNIAPFRVMLLDEMAKNTKSVTLYYFNEIDKGVNPEYVNKRPNIAQYKSLKNLKKNERRQELLKNDIIIFDGYTGKEKLNIMLNLIFRRKTYFISIDGIIKKNGKDNELKKIIKSLLFRNSKMIFSTNEATDKILYSINKNLNIKRHIFTTLTSLDFYNIKYLDKNVIINKFNINTDKKIILFVGKFLKTKGIYELLKTINSKYEYIFVGGTKEELKYTGKEENIRFFKFLEKDEILELMKIADVFVLPTYSDVWGLVVIEALSVGLPVVTTDKCNAGLEFIENGVNGYIIPTKDVNTLNEAIENALKLDKNYVEIINNEKMKKYTLENSALDILESISEG